MSRTGWRITLAAAALTALGMGGRQVVGMFVSPLNTASGLGLPSISLALALGQLGVGCFQPVLGRYADRTGVGAVIVPAALVLAASTALPALLPMRAAVFGGLLVAAVAGSAVGSNGLLLGAVSRSAPAGHAGLAVGVVGAGASAGQLVLGPSLQWLIDRHGWQAAMLMLAALALAALPLARMLRDTGAPATHRGPMPIGDALRDLAFWRVALSFAICGLHVAFLAAHMPGAIDRCGFPASLAGPWMALAGAANIAGSLAVGVAMKHVEARRLLAAVYAARALAIAAFVAAPPSLAGLMLFAVLMGASHTATLPPTAALVARRYGTHRLGVLFGVVMLVHQVGAFAGIWLGGVLAQASGSDTRFWSIDIALALVAALLVLPRAARQHRAPAAAGASLIPR